MISASTKETIKNTAISAIVVGLISSTSMLWLTAVEAMEQVKANAQEIRKLQIFAADNELSNLRAEKRLISRDKEKNPDSDLLDQQLDDVENNIHKTELRRDCLLDMLKVDCK